MRAVILGDTEKQRGFAISKKKMVENIVDSVNEISNEIIGDILIEEIDGEYRIIDEYISYISEE